MGAEAEMTPRVPTTVLAVSCFLLIASCAGIPRGRTTALHEATDRGDIQALRDMLADTTRVDSRDESGRTALHHAALSGDILVVAALLDAGANPNLQDISGRVPLHYAVLVCSADLAAMLLGAGADTAISDKKDISPLELARETDCEEVVETITSSQ